MSCVVRYDGRGDEGSCRAVSGRLSRPTLVGELFAQLWDRRLCAADCRRPLHNRGLFGVLFILCHVQLPQTCMLVILCTISFVHARRAPPMLVSAFIRPLQYSVREYTQFRCHVLPAVPDQPPPLLHMSLREQEATLAPALAFVRNFRNFLSGLSLTRQQFPVMGGGGLRLGP